MRRRKKRSRHTKKVYLKNREKSSLYVGFRMEKTKQASKKKNDDYECYLLLIRNVLFFCFSLFFLFYGNKKNRFNINGKTLRGWESKGKPHALGQEFPQSAFAAVLSLRIQSTAPRTRYLRDSRLMYAPMQVIIYKTQLNLPFFFSGRLRR